MNILSLQDLLLLCCCACCLNLNVACKAYYLMVNWNKMHYLQTVMKMRSWLCCIVIVHDDDVMMRAKLFLILQIIAPY